MARRRAEYGFLHGCSELNLEMLRVRAKLVKLNLKGYLPWVPNWNLKGFVKFQAETGKVIEGIVAKCEFKSLRSWSLWHKFLPKG